MKLAIVSTMEGFPWGGSEELWFRVALSALEKGHTVLVCVKAWPAVPVKVSLLRERGALVLLREKESAAIPNRFVKIFRGERNKEASYLQAIRAFAPDRLLVSQGGTFDLFRRPELLELVRTLDCPLFLLSQFNFENGGLLDSRTRDEVRKLTERWRKFYFVSWRNLETAGRQAAMVIPRTAVVSNPVNYEAAGLLPWPGGPLRLACVARYQCSLKGQDILLQALASPQLRDYSFTLNLFGQGPDEEHLQMLIRLYGLSQRVHLAGHAHDMEAVWKEHHALVLPSLAEGTPLALQECMLKGRPALVTDVGDCSRLISDSDTGWLCPVASPAYLEQSLLRLFETSPARMEEMGRLAYARAKASVNLASAQEMLADIEKG